MKKTSTTVKIDAGAQTLTPTPTVSGTSKVGQTLTATPGNWDSGVNLTYQWFRDGVAISGATNTTYALTPDDNTKQISVEITGTKTGYATVKKTSTTVKVVPGTMLAVTPKITGTSKVGLTLKAATSSWVKSAKITYKWLANGVAIKGATSSSLKLTATLKGKKITVTVTQTAPGYTTTSKISSSVTVR